MTKCGKNDLPSGIITVIMPSMYTRSLKLPDRSFFLFGPRGTGKTTWLRQMLPEALWFDLLRTGTFLALSRQSNSFRAQVESRPHGSWIVIDEVQRLPTLLNEVHALIADHGRAWKFALSGSSARKLKRLDVNLLAGRAINRQFFPLTAAELGYDIEIDRVLRFGLLPQIHAEAEYALDALEAYVENYIREEIQQEALVRNLESFARFLEVAALANGQVVNTTAVARDAATARPTVQGYFSVLVDTLIGYWLPAWQRKARIKETAHPRFFLFDPGVVRGLSGRLREPLDGLERGFLLETWLLHELRAAMATRNTGGNLHYWRTPSGSEIDFIWTRAGRSVGIEVKASTVWRREHGIAVRSLLDDKILQAGFGVYTGKIEMKQGQMWIMPIITFLKKLGAGEIIG